MRDFGPNKNEVFSELNEQNLSNGVLSSRSHREESENTTPESLRPLDEVSECQFSCRQIQGEFASKKPNKQSCSAQKCRNDTGSISFYSCRHEELISGWMGWCNSPHSRIESANLEIRWIQIRMLTHKHISRTQFSTDFDERYVVRSEMTWRSF